MEDSLRKMKHAGTGPSAAAMEALAAGTNVIEEIVAARRVEKPFPEINSVLSRLTAVVLTPERLWLFKFSPSVELSARGVHVNSIRSRLDEIGRVVNATPRIIPAARGEVGGGQVTFDFIVAGNIDESRFSGWQLDGLTAAPHGPALDPALDAAEMNERRPITPSTNPTSAVRVDMKRMDHLMTMVGELVISRGHVEESLRRLETVLPKSAWRELQEANLLLQRQLRDLREGVMRIRMVPIGRIFERMHFLVRGLAREGHKVVRLDVTGHDIEIDKRLVDTMMDPLLHMVRNAVSHGLESSAERIASGKAPEGQLRLRASTEAEAIVIELEDDGRGVDTEEVTKRSQSLGLIEAGDISAKTMDSSRVLQMLCTPGFTTRDEADLGAGRGFGMAVVKTTISGLGGTLSMETAPGKGTRFIIRLPLTLAIMQALIGYVDDQPFAVLRAAIDEVLRIETDAVTICENKEVIPYRGGILPIVYLHQVFKMNGKSKNFVHVFVVRSGFGAVGIAVDRIGGQREIVVRSIEDPLVRVPGIAGATELGDGRPVLILDVAALVGGV